ncbi:hypothetical protein [Caballeronia sp. SBC2]|uniref:hypothetical protein n=1 Tax=Caballeronia sp. SBC2 TaxID=2705547 RepID=UPI0013E1B262|nr:hypothetical protein [Caballeronia sp. SBC2]QIE29581.1 hypothetical protein SBC2_76570 [Caballeronia sp. SBC2]
MPKIELQHNDDEVLDPLDSTLRTRGSLRVDGHERGSWEEHLDGHCVGRLDGTELIGRDKGHLITIISQHLSTTSVARIYRPKQSIQAGSSFDGMAVFRGETVIVWSYAEAS